MSDLDCAHRRAFTTDREWWCPDCEDYEELDSDAPLAPEGELF